MSIPPNPRRVGYIVSVHKPLDEPLYMGSHIHQHPPQSELPAQWCSRLDNKKANTPLQSELPAQRCSRLDNKKANTPPQSELPSQRCSRLDKKKVQRANTPPQPQLATGYVEAGAKLREVRGGQSLGEDVGKLGGGRDMEYSNIADGDPVAHEV